MTFTQLEYILAVNIHRHFADAAESCHITQPTLSMQIQKLEEELAIKIFDRSKQPVVPTIAGEEIIDQARKILAEKDILLEMISSKKDLVKGELKVGVIPTLAPYLLPLFIPPFIRKYPQVKLHVIELTTSSLIKQLREGQIDMGILVTPLNEKGIKEDALFYEEMLVYTSSKNKLLKKHFILSKDIDPNKLLLLEEGHCFRSQIINLCELRKHSYGGSHFEYEAGSLETLRRMVDASDGITILPELSTNDMNDKDKLRLRHFKSPAPVREVGIVTHRDFVKRKLVNAIKQAILENIPAKLQSNGKKYIVPINV
ncbi:hydrogen peroxide-inducible genes activator [Arachidicoccus soli]|uniref:Hydrogen peroxide-inducible genes activator n=1 Tax=Arachidicoccus soli TaxID=2341117 RepID=A0A386HL61_9BACT|nr:hydrogen peroxide-inducible genes activator [Arachidicoccus soli]AYD46515.1 hydrogen peroxide-inducible genes activator [Arachidicoccus soli]